MKSSEFRGISPVFKFTLGQTLKQKSYVITLVIMLIFALGTFPVMKLMGKKSKNDVTTIEKVYVINNTNLDTIPFEKMSEEHEYLKDVEYVVTQDDIDTATKKLEDNSNEGTEKNSVIIDASIDISTGAYVFTVYYTPSSSVSEGDVSTLSDDITEWFTDYKKTMLNLDESVLDSITAKVDSKIVEYDDFVSSDKVRIITSTEYNVVYAILMVFYMVIVLTASMVANKIVEEKANRIVEFLMTTVRPMALMIGKIAAMLIAGVGEVVLIIVAGFASYKVSEVIWPSESNSVVSSFLSIDGIKNLGFLNIVICILIMIIGVVMYSLIAGLFAASVSKMEEVQQGLKTFTLIILVAFFASLIGINLMWTVGINAYVKAIMYIPITSVMVLPGVILIGQAGIVEIAISMLIMVVTALILLWFISLIYESVIVMNGSTVSTKTMFKMAKDSLGKGKGGKANEEE